MTFFDAVETMEPIQGLDSKPQVVLNGALGSIGRWNSGVNNFYSERAWADTVDYRKSIDPHQETWSTAY